MPTFKESYHPKRIIDVIADRPGLSKATQKTYRREAENVLEAAIVCGVQRVICLSTDKAVYPINAMGISKALMEKVAISKSKNSDSTVICVTRYGNVMGSRGSVIPLFINQIRNGKPITITDPNMTRFMMSLDDAVDLVLYAFNEGKSGDIFVQKSPATTIKILANALSDLMGVPNHSVDIIGTRHGEKLFEVLLSREEMVSAIDMENYYRIPADLRDLNYGKFVDEGEERISHSEDYNSHNTERLDINDLKTLLKKIPLIRDAISGDFKDFED